MTISPTKNGPGRRSHIIALHDVWRIYPGTPDVLALRNVNCEIAAGEYVSVVGPSGSGKSTLLNILGLLDRATIGVYELDGIDTGPLQARDRAYLRSVMIGFAFQGFHLLSRRSTFENVLIGMAYSGIDKRRRFDLARAALERVGLADRMAALPATLSGGERQRVALARAVAGGPALLLADEPTGNLDAGTGATVLDMLDEFHANGLTLLVATHDPAVAERASRKVSIVEGTWRELS